MTTINQCDECKGIPPDKFILDSSGSYTILIEKVKVEFIFDFKEKGHICSVCLVKEIKTAADRIVEIPGIVESLVGRRK